MPKGILFYLVRWACRPLIGSAGSIGSIGSMGGAAHKKQSAAEYT